jgi:hypothetical protein
MGQLCSNKSLTRISLVLNYRLASAQDNANLKDLKDLEANKYVCAEWPKSDQSIFYKFFEVFEVFAVRMRG